VFVDESWASTNMARRYGRCPRGERLRMAVPHGHWKTTTLIAGMRSSGVVAPLVIDRPVNRLIFEAWVEQALVLELRPGAIVVMDNLSSHKGPAVRARSYSTCRPIAPTSIRSRTCSPRSKPSFERKPRAPSTRCGPP